MNTSEKSKVSFMEKGRVMVPFFVAALLAGAGFAQAQFVGPPGPAPTCPAGQPGCDAPINVGSGSQRKTGEVYFASTTFSSLGRSVSVGGGQVISGDMIWAKSGLFGSDAPTVFKNRVTIVPSGTADIDVPAQVVGASFNIATPNAGFLPPRVTDPTTISSAFTDAAKKLAAKGLLVHDMTKNKLQQWDGTAWVDVGGAPAAPAGADQTGPSFRATANGGAMTTALNTLTYSAEDFDRPDNTSFANNTFKPRYPGQYLLVANVAYAPVSITIVASPPLPVLTLEFTKNGAPEKQMTFTPVSLTTTQAYYQGAGYFIKSGVMSSSVVIDVSTADAEANNNAVSTDDVLYSVRTSNSGQSTNGGQLNIVGASSYFAGSRVGSPLKVVNEAPDTYYINAVAPKNAVMFFDADACPTPGWGEYTNLRGRYVVGLPSGGTRGGIPAGTTALGNLENRAVGLHTHSGYVGAQGYNVPTDKSGQYLYANNVINTVPNGVTGEKNDVPGTNAPYVQLLACKKLVD